MTEPADEDVLSIDDHAHPWTEEDATALARWSQGDLMQGVPLLWAEPDAHPRPAPVTPGGTNEAALLSPFASDGSFPWAAITSQTCDIGASGPGARHPFVQVSPVVSLAGKSENAITAIKTHQKVDMVALTEPPEPGDWAVDVRVSIPVRKEALLGATPVHGFRTESDALDFAERLAHRASRPALHADLSEKLPDALKQYMRATNKKQPEWWQHLQQIRVRVTGGTRLAPTTVVIYFVENIRLTEEQREVWRQWAASFRKQLRDTSGIQLAPVLFATLEDLSAKHYAESTALPNSVFPF